MKAGVAFLGAWVLALAVLAIADEAKAAPPVVCLRNSTGRALDVVVGVREDTPDKLGTYWGKARARGGACKYMDIDEQINLYVRRAAPLPPKPAGDTSDLRTLPTATGGWTKCPPNDDGTGNYVFTVSPGLICTVGGSTVGLEGPGDYE